MGATVAVGVGGNVGVSVGSENSVGVAVGSPKDEPRVAVGVSATGVCGGVGVKSISGVCAALGIVGVTPLCTPPGLDLAGCTPCQAATPVSAPQMRKRNRAETSSATRLAGKSGGLVGIPVVLAGTGFPANRAPQAGQYGCPSIASAPHCGHVAAIDTTFLPPPACFARRVSS